MTLDELVDEAVDVLAALERIDAHLEVDDGAVTVYTSPSVPSLGDLAARIPGVRLALAAVVTAEGYVREAQ